MIPLYQLAKDAPPAPLPALPSLPAGEPPARGIYYVVAQSGVYKRVRNDFYDATVKVPGVPHLRELQEGVRLGVPKLPWDLLRQAEAFFAAVYELHRSEAIVILHAHPGLGEWRLAVPRQDVKQGALHVQYDPTSVEAPKGFHAFGTIHSHAGIGAFHSGADDKDETCSDGLHVTVGNLDKPQRSYAARWMICGTPFPVHLHDVVEAPESHALDPRWMDNVRLQEPERRENPSELSLLDDPWLTPFGGEENVPPELRTEYDDYMLQMHERFVDRVARRHART